VLVAIGVLPGYRGVWRAMHLGGRVSVETARRLWPAWAERAAEASESTSGDAPVEEAARVEPPPRLRDRVGRALAAEWRRPSAARSDDDVAEGEESS
jgi:hypothetical protein